MILDGAEIESKISEEEGSLQHFQGSNRIVFSHFLEDDFSVMQMTFELTCEKLFFAFA